MVGGRLCLHRCQSVHKGGRVSLVPRPFQEKGISGRVSKGGSGVRYPGVRYRGVGYQGVYLTSVNHKSGR